MGTKTLIRLLIILGVVALVAVILHFAGSGRGVSEVKSTTKKAKVFEEFPLNEIATVHVDTGAEELVLEKGEDRWEVAARDGYPADAEKITQLLKTVWDLNIVQPVTIGRDQYSRLHLVDPGEEGGDETATIVRFKGGGDEDLGSLWLGKVYEKSENRPSPFGGGMATTDAGRYIKPGGSNRVFLVGETFDDVEIDPAEWLDESFFEVEGVKSIAIDSGVPEDDWKLVREEESADFSFASPKDGEEVDGGKTSSMKSAFANPSFEDVLIDTEAEENQVGATTFTIETFDGFTYVISVGEKNDLNELPLTVSVSGEFPEEREKGEEETEEEAENLDKKFEEDREEFEEKLAAEQALEGHVYLVRSFLVDSISKKRSELLKEEEEEESGAAPGSEIAPGITLPGPGSTGGKAKDAAPSDPAPAPKSAAKAEPKARANPGKAKGAASPDPAPAPQPAAKAEPKARANPGKAKGAASPDPAPAPKPAAKAEPKPAAKAGAEESPEPSEQSDGAAKSQPDNPGGEGENP